MAPILLAFLGESVEQTVRNLPNQFIWPGGRNGSRDRMNKL